MPNAPSTTTTWVFTHALGLTAYCTVRPTLASAGDWDVCLLVNGETIRECLPTRESARRLACALAGALLESGWQLETGQAALQHEARFPSPPRVG